jgi:hypothetical protein
VRNLFACLLVMLSTCSVHATDLDFTEWGVTSWTCPAGVTSVTITARAAGGGGGGGSMASHNGGGGGGGGCLVYTRTVVPSTIYWVYVGHGGALGLGSDYGQAGSGGTGGDSWFGDTDTDNSKRATGGIGGTWEGVGGSGGSAVCTGTYSSYPGAHADGEMAYTGPYNTGWGGTGGNGAFSGGAGGAGGTGYNAGTPGTVAGGGGGGGGASVFGGLSGGRGADGKVTLTY